MSSLNNLLRRLFLSTLTIALFFGFVAVQSNVQAAEFPIKDKPIEIIIHSGYGGGTDVTARMVSIDARKQLKADIIIAGKRGGSGSKAHDYIMSKAADGHTVLALTQTHLYTIARGKSKMKITDIVGIARAMDDPTFLVVSGKSPYKTFKDLVEASKKKPINLGIANIGGTEHIGAAELAKYSGLQFKPVAFEGGGKMVQALMSGSIDATVPNVSESLNQIKDGTFKALLVMSEKKLKDFPNVPTSFELGYKVNCSTTRGYAVLATTPKPIIEALSKSFVKSMNSDLFVTYLKSSGLTPEDSIAGSEVWDKQLKAEYASASKTLGELGMLK